MEELNIEDFREFLEITKRMHDDEQLDMFLKTCINSLWIMQEQGNQMAEKTLIELQNYL